MFFFLLANMKYLSKARFYILFDTNFINVFGLTRCIQLLSSYLTVFLNRKTVSQILLLFKINWTTSCLVFAFLHVETTNALYNINKMPNNPAFICKVLYTRGWNERRPDNINGNEYNRNKIEGDTLGRRKLFLCNQTLATANEDSEGVAEWICNAMENGIKWECIYMCGWNNGTETDVYCSYPFPSIIFFTYMEMRSNDIQSV